jgi:hypothetical protein
LLFSSLFFSSSLLSFISSMAKLFCTTAFSQFILTSSLISDSWPDISLGEDSYSFVLVRRRLSGVEVSVLVRGHSRSYLFLLPSFSEVYIIDVASLHTYITLITIWKNKLRGLSSRTNCTYRGTTACRRS